MRRARPAAGIRVRTAGRHVRHTPGTGPDRIRTGVPVRPGRGTVGTARIMGRVRRRGGRTLDR